MKNRKMIEESIEKAFKALDKELDKEKDPICAERVAALVHTIEVLSHISRLA